MHATLPRLRDTDFPAIRRGGLKTLQANLGYRCNQSCLHCHVAAGPNRTERMDRDTIETMLAILARGGIENLDLTGGAPELHPDFRHLVSRAQALGTRVIDRCNLTILEEPDQEDLAQFLAAQSVEIIASLPCYLQENVEAQRGKGVFEASIAGLKRLNALGYGRGDSGLVLGLVYNPQGPELPPEQTGLEAAYRARLSEEYGIRFDQLFALANMPIQRFGSTSSPRASFDAYLQLLRDAHRNDNLASVMCRDLISIDWRGFVYDCDFNQMLDMLAPRRHPVPPSPARPRPGAPAGAADPGGRPLLWLYGRTGIELLGRLGWLSHASPAARSSPRLGSPASTGRTRRRLRTCPCGRPSQDPPDPRSGRGGCGPPASAADGEHRRTALRLRPGKGRAVGHTRYRSSLFRRVGGAVAARHLRTGGPGPGRAHGARRTFGPDPRRGRHPGRHRLPRPLAGFSQSRYRRTGASGRRPGPGTGWRLCPARFALRGEHTLRADALGQRPSRRGHRTAARCTRVAVVPSGSPARDIDRPEDLAYLPARISPVPPT